MKAIFNSKAEKLVNIEFNVFKFNDKPKPDKDKITIVSCLSEFGCETIGCLFCLPRIFKEIPGDYKIAVGWYGREYFYRHLVDEFWEIKEEFQWLRDYCKAFHNDSKNLAKLENALSAYGKTIKSHQLGQIAVGNRCKKCGHLWGDTNYVKECPNCKGDDIIRSLFGDVQYYKKQAVPIPKPSAEKMELADKYLKENPVAIFARGRTTYGRNLQPEFYVKLISLLESMGYNPVWLGEKQSTLACPVDHIVDFSRLPECRDLELTCAIVSKCKFTVQFWTASTRIAALMGTPHLMFESPMQIWGEGQEGFRLGLLKDMAPIKIVISHFLNTKEDHPGAIKIIERAIKEMEVGNYKDIIGLVDNRTYTESLRTMNKRKTGL